MASGFTLPQLATRISSSIGLSLEKRSLCLRNEDLNHKPAPGPTRHEQLNEASMPPSHVSLVPINLHDCGQFELLLAQRIKCGWSDTEEVLIHWRDSDGKVLFWIVVGNGSIEGEVTGANCVKVGHVSIDRGEAWATDDTSRPPIKNGSVDGPLFTISKLFIRKDFRGGGLADRALDILEGFAEMPPNGDPGCVGLCVNCPSLSYYSADDGEEGKRKPEWAREFRNFSEVTRRTAVSYEKWYARRGFVKYDERPTYPGNTLSGKDTMVYAAFMFKDVQEVGE